MNITLPRAVIEQALDALASAEDQLPKPYSTSVKNAATALRTALEQPEQEPVGWMLKTGHGTVRLLYTAPPQRKPLTEKEIEKCYETSGHYQTLRPQDRFAVFALARAIEAAHGIKE